MSAHAVDPGRHRPDGDEGAAGVGDRHDEERVLRVPISAPPITPNLTAWLEVGLRALRETGLTEPERLSVVLLLSGFVRSEATLVADIGAAEQPIMPRLGERLRSLTDAEHSPALHAALASEAFDQDDDPDDEFDFGLKRILDGVAALVDRRGV